MAERRLKGQLRGRLWEWTSTPYDDERLVLRSVDDGDRSDNDPGDRYDGDGLRLVEDL